MASIDVLLRACINIYLHTFSTAIVSFSTLLVEAVNHLFQSSAVQPRRTSGLLLRLLDLCLLYLPLLSVYITWTYGA